MKTRFLNSRRYLPGDPAPASAIYRVCHGIKHRDDHDVLLIRGEQFPACRTCKHNVKFSVNNEVSLVTYDFDFAGPAEFTERSAARRRSDTFKTA